MGGAVDQAPHRRRLHHDPRQVMRRHVVQLPGQTLPLLVDGPLDEAFPLADLPLQQQRPVLTRIVHHRPDEDSDDVYAQAGWPPQDGEPEVAAQRECRRQRDEGLDAGQGSGDGQGPSRPHPGAHPVEHQQRGTGPWPTGMGKSAARANCVMAYPEKVCQGRACHRDQQQPLERHKRRQPGQPCRQYRSFGCREARQQLQRGAADEHKPAEQEACCGQQYIQQPNPPKHRAQELYHEPILAYPTNTRWRCRG